MTKRSPSRWKGPPCPDVISLELIRPSKGTADAHIVAAHPRSREMAKYAFQGLPANRRTTVVQDVPIPTDAMFRAFLWPALYSIRPWKKRGLNLSYLLLTYEDENNGVAIGGAAPTLRDLKEIENTKYYKNSTYVALMYHVSTKMHFAVDAPLYKLDEDIWGDTLTRRI